MARRVRKQICIDAYHERLLKREARQTGTPEAAIIRQLLDAHFRRLQASKDRRKIWEEERRFIEGWMGRGAVPGGRSWRREDLYDRGSV